MTRDALFFWRGWGSIQRCRALARPNFKDKGRPTKHEVRDAKTTNWNNSCFHKQRFETMVWHRVGNIFFSFYWKVFFGRGATKVSLKLAKNEPCTDGFATNVSQNTSEPTNKQTSKQANKQASKQANKQTSKQTSKQTNKQANKQFSKQASKQTNKTNKNKNYSIMRFPNWLLLSLCWVFGFKTTVSKRFASGLKTYLSGKKGSFLEGNACFQSATCFCVQVCVEKKD